MKKINNVENFVFTKNRWNSDFFNHINKKNFILCTTESQLENYEYTKYKDFIIQKENGTLFEKYYQLLVDAYNKKYDFGLFWDDDYKLQPKRYFVHLQKHHVLSENEINKIKDYKYDDIYTYIRKKIKCYYDHKSNFVSANYKRFYNLNPSNRFVGPSLYSLRSIIYYMTHCLFHNFEKHELTLSDDTLFSAITHYYHPELISIYSQYSNINFPSQSIELNKNNEETFIKNNEEFLLKKYPLIKSFSYKEKYKSLNFNVRYNFIRKKEEDFKYHDELFKKFNKEN